MIILQETTYNFDFYTQYSQFYLSSDGPNSIDNLYGQPLTKEQYKLRLRVFENLVVIITESYGQIRGHLSILNIKPANNLEGYDHVVEGSITVKNEKLEILDCPNVSQEVMLPIPNGTYRVRVSGSNYNTVEGDQGDDHYKIEIWPAPFENIVVLKQYKNE